LLGLSRNQENQKLENYMKIKTNNHFRPVIYWQDLEASEQSELSGSYDTIEESSFFRYRGHVYNLGEFLSARGNGAHELVNDWDGYHNDSFFSAVLVKYSDDGDAVKVGLALS